MNIRKLKTWWKQTLPTTQHIEEPSSEGMFQGRQPQRFSASWAFQRNVIKKHLMYKGITYLPRALQHTI